MNLLKSYARILAVACLAISLISCDTTDNTEQELDLIPIHSVTVDGYDVSLEAAAELETGANFLYWKVAKNGEIIHPQSIAISPMMDMGEMMHSTPYEQPEVAPEDENYLKNLAVFIMPGGMMGSWSIPFEITTKTDEVLSGEMPLEVNSSWKMTSVKSDSGNVYYISWLAPQTPVSGNNDLSFYVHTRESMMNFPAVENAEIIIHPFMDMGGGSGHSTNFTNPVAAGNGKYEGKINYSMSGTWTTSVKLIVEGDTLPEAVFEYQVLAK